MCDARGQWETASLGRFPLPGDQHPEAGKEGQLQVGVGAGGMEVERVGQRQAGYWLLGKWWSVGRRE